MIDENVTGVHMTEQEADPASTGQNGLAAHDY